MPHSLTLKEKRFAILVLLSVALVFGAIVYFVRPHGGVGGGKLAEATISFFYGLLAALFIALIAFASKPFQNWLQEYLAIPDGNAHEVRVLLFGQTGSGKTSFALSVLTTKPLETMESTAEFVARSGTVTLAPEKNISIVLGDYRGEEPSLATSRIPETFAGVDGSRLIDALIFFVDLIGREHDAEQPGQVLDDDRLLQWLVEAPAR